MMCWSAEQVKACRIRKFQEGMTNEERKSPDAEKRAQSHIEAKIMEENAYEKYLKDNPPTRPELCFAK